MRSFIFLLQSKKSLLQLVNMTDIIQMYKKTLFSAKPSK